MPLPFLSLKELAMRTVLQEDVSFEALPNTFTLRRELDKLCDFPGSYKLNETRPEKFTKTGGGAPTPEEINRVKSTLVSTGFYRYRFPPRSTLSISKASKTSDDLWLLKLSNNDLVWLPSRNVTSTDRTYRTVPYVGYVIPGYYLEASTEIADGNVTFKNIWSRRFIPRGDKPSIFFEEEWLFEMEDDNKMMKLTEKNILHEVDPDIKLYTTYVFRRI